MITSPSLISIYFKLIIFHLKNHGFMLLSFPTFSHPMDLAVLSYLEIIYISKYQSTKKVGYHGSKCDPVSPTLYVDFIQWFSLSSTSEDML